ncbi:hypothetical protein [Marimonas lutisalis]|uniref:hypothetical protein n=1 Tax=Marimonas lutisalis TaxID=2545756 RepID=UPI0010F6AE0B|nr:hypothetical protein [Marimonas lutisalis]
MRATKIITLGLVAGLLASCGAVDKLKPKKGLYFDGQQFRARLEQLGDEHKEFAVSVFNVSKSLEGARQAGAYEATRHCIEYFGNSDIEWDVGPEDESLTVQDDTITFRGRCEGW